MEYDNDKVDDAALALLFLTMEKVKLGDMVGAKAWKGMDWDVLDRLHEKGYIDDPKNKNKSVVFSEEGMKRSEQLFWKLFGKS
jgi:hypothetical protein